VSLKRLKVRGSFRGPTGHDHHVRQFVRAFHGQGVDVQLIDMPSWSPAVLPDGKRDPWFDSLARPLDARVFVQFCMPHQAEPEEGRVNVNYTMFEAGHVPARWVADGFRQHRVVLPSESSRQAWIGSGLPDSRIRVCPLGVDPDLYSRTHAPLDWTLVSGSHVSDYGTRFLNVSELGPRKNLLGLLRVWLRATSRRDDAVLVVKLGCHAPDLRARFTILLHMLERDSGKRFLEAAPVHYVYDLFSDEEMPRLYAAATHYISLSHGEGWDQPMMEAGASGLALIAPRHSAYTAYLDETIADLVPTREIPAVYNGDPDTAALFEGANWWAPDEDAAAAFLRAAIDRTGTSGGPARSRILRHFTWEQAARRLLDILDEAAEDASAAESGSS